MVAMVEMMIMIMYNHLFSVGYQSKLDLLIEVLYYNNSRTTTTFLC